MSTRAAVEQSMDLHALVSAGEIHFMGVGGAGMSALAELVIRAGGRVTGCDRALGESVDRLRELGAGLHEGHDAAHAEHAAAIVVTAAVPQTHPELQAARDRGVPVFKRAQALGGIVNRGTLVAVAGTHGKTTTTYMTTAILEEAGHDPTALVGGRVAEWGGGLRLGRDDLFVVEADEYDRSFFTLRPSVVVVTSVEADHLDIYGDLEGVLDAFRHFLRLVPEQGAIIACADDPGVRDVASGLKHEIVWYGTGDAALRASGIEFHGTHTHFDVTRGDERLGRIELAVPGLHNVRNALGALGAALHLGADFAAAARALARFHGVARRFQPMGSANGVEFIDDYAHHPTEVAATLAAARAAHPAARVVAVFQPHLFSRTRDLATEFGQALAAADVVYLTGIYAAREQPLLGVTGELLADAAQQAGAADVRYHESLDALEMALESELRAGDLCIAMGAGDIDVSVRRVLERMSGGAA